MLQAKSASQARLCQQHRAGTSGCPIPTLLCAGSLGGVHLVFVEKLLEILLCGYKVKYASRAENVQLYLFLTFVFSVDVFSLFIMQCLIVPFAPCSTNWFLQCGSLSSFCRHFLFKHGSGSSAIFSAASQNYPLTSNTVYSPPPRPLPRNTFSRPAFTFSKPYRCCNWKCTALSATAITVTLALLLAYVIGKPLFLFYAELFVPFLLCCHAYFYSELLYKLCFTNNACCGMLCEFW